MILLNIQLGGSPMKLRVFLISAVMMSLTVVSAKAINPSIPSPLIAEDKILGTAYYDTLSILSTPNECSDFFGGISAVESFNGLISKVRKDYFSSAIGIRMSGATTNIFNTKTQNRYRLFNKVSINGNGPFYKNKLTHTQPFIPGIGRFAANTKEARVLMFLHELGHVLGLRHEFAIESEQGSGAMRLFSTDKESIMSYYFPPQIQESDKKDLRAFYSLPQLKDFVPNN